MTVAMVLLCLLSDTFHQGGTVFKNKAYNEKMAMTEGNGNPTQACHLTYPEPIIKQFIHSFICMRLPKEVL